MLAPRTPEGLPAFLSNFTLIWILASLANSKTTSLGKSPRVTRNVNTIIAQAVGKAILLYNAYPLLKKAFNRETWGKEEWDRYRKGIAIHSAMYLFDATYRFDPILFFHHLVAVPMMYIPLLIRDSVGWEVGARMGALFWIPGVTLGDPAEEFAYLVHQGILFSEPGRRRELARKFAAVLNAGVRTSQWSAIGWIAKSWHREGGKDLKGILAVMPVFAVIEGMMAVNMWKKAFPASISPGKSVYLKS